ncbi:hypothetical protein pEaSNUABM11_00081 [Erwinia phage pEa_SNUABM_11]|nr:hypothetical protein pEaSNUABM11_00081 [Erwinia phage pEa_SNUABM_11]
MDDKVKLCAELHRRAREAFMSGNMSLYREIIEERKAVMYS